jgi:hypothetical protein
MSEIKPDVESIVKYLENFIEFCDCGNPKADCICIDKNGWETSREYKLKTQLKEAEKLANFTKKYALDHWVGKDLWDEMEKEYKTKYTKE